MTIDGAPYYKESRNPANWDDAKRSEQVHYAFFAAHRPGLATNIAQRTDEPPAAVKRDWESDESGAAEVL